MFVQTGPSVDAVVGSGEGTPAARMTGTVSIGGELQLPTAPVLPVRDPDGINAQIQNWRG